MKVKVIINPTAGRETIKQPLEGLINRLEQEGVISQSYLCYTTTQQNARVIASDESTLDYDVLLVAGGDGTANQALNGLLEAGYQVPLALLAGGTVNDFATALQLPCNVEEMEKLLRSHRVEEVDVGQVNDQYFLNVCAGGLLTEVAYTTPSKLKTLLGRLAYVLTGIVSAPKNLLNPRPFRFVTPSEVIEEEILLFMVGNSRSVGGFENIMPLASVQDGMLDLLMIRSVPRSIADIPSVVALFSQMHTGGHLNSPIIYYRQVKQVEIECLDGKPVVLDHDGEQGLHLPALIRSVPRKIKLLLPNS